MLNEDIISMPDKWEYRWYAACDLAFHTTDEWNFSDVNPSVHAWATMFLDRTEQALLGETDVVSSSRRSTSSC
jgi:hypothetical protein